MDGTSVRRATRTDEVAAHLRRDILSGDLVPGVRLKFPDLAERYGASVGVIREALLRLMERGLVVSEPRLGFSVVSVSQAGLAELTEARTELEVIVLRRAIADGGLDWESRVVAAHHQYEHTPRTTGSRDAAPSEPWLEAHAAFHNALLSGCGNARLLAMAQSMRDVAELYRRWSKLPAEVPTDETAREEHRALLAAALSRDADQAEGELRRLLGFSALLDVDSLQLGMPR